MQCAVHGHGAERSRVQGTYTSIADRVRVKLAKTVFFKKKLEPLAKRKIRPRSRPLSWLGFRLGAQLTTMRLILRILLLQVAITCFSVVAQPAGRPHLPYVYTSVDGDVDNYTSNVVGTIPKWLKATKFNNGTLVQDSV